MSVRKKNLFQLIICSVFLYACAYIVTPAPEVTPTSVSAKDWLGVATNVGKSDAGDLHIEITIRNETGAWSSMQAAADRPAVLASGGKTSDCSTVFVSSGGHSLAPGFQMRGYTGGTKAEPKPQLLYVECKGAPATPGSTLTINYSFVTGDFNYYVASKPVNSKLVINLDEVATDLQYPVADTVAGLIEKSDAKIDAINKCTLTLTDIKRTDTGLEFAWHTENPGDYPTYVHIGTPPVIGKDGIIYGVYESPNLADAPITLPGEKADWTSSVAVPKDVSGLYILLSVESKQQKLFVSHAIDITDK